MQPRNPDWDNPNMPNQDWDEQNPHMPKRDRNRQRDWDQQNPNIPNQGWGQQSPNTPNSDPNMPNQGWGQQNPNAPNSDPNMPNQGWGQQNPNTPNYDPNVPNQGWDQQNPNTPNYDPNRPNQGWGQQNPNAPNYDPNRPNQGWGQQNPNAPNYDPNMQGQRQDVSRQPDQRQRDIYAAPNDSPYSDDEWKNLLAAPLLVGKAMMFASPSGPVGLIQETKAMVDCLQGLLKQKETSPLLRALGQSAQKIVNAARTNNPQHIISELSGTSKDPQVCRTDALTSCQRASMSLKNTSAQDTAAYTQFVFNCAQKVAEAAKEGSIMSMGGSRVSPAERSLLRELAGALGIQQA